MKTIIVSLMLITSSLSRAQNLHKEVLPEKGPPFLVGKIAIEDLNSENYLSWYQASYQSYEVDDSLTAYFKEKLGHYRLKLFLGTWCGDSKKQVPRILKILEQAEFPDERLEIIALDRRPGRYKKSPTGEERGLNIIKVPTLIFFKNGIEINRIVERPIASLEEDILTILNGGHYIPNYSSR